jgi:hypothetical protein
MLRMKGIRMKGGHHSRTPSCFAIADRWRYPNAIQLRARPRLPIMIMTYG